jgi:hypothetical protein
VILDVNPSHMCNILQTLVLICFIFCFKNQFIYLRVMSHINKLGAEQHHETNTMNERID